MHSLKYFLLQNTVYKRVRPRSITWIYSKVLALNHVKSHYMLWIDGNFYKLNAPFHWDQRYTVYYFQETSIKLVYFQRSFKRFKHRQRSYQNLKPVAITEAIERIQELTSA